MGNTVASKVQIRVLVPVSKVFGYMSGDKKHEAFQAWVCDNFGGFSVNANERIQGAWRNPETGKIELDIMMVYYIWLDNGTAEAIGSDCRLIADKVMEIFSEKAVSIIRDNTVTPMIFS